MTLKFTIPGELPTKNEIINASKSHWSRYKRLKDEFDSLIGWSIKSLPKLKYSDYTITWYCKDKRKDKDNIMSGQKFIFDSLQKMGKIENDGWAQIGDITHRFEVDKKNPRIEVEIIERVTACN